jgi:hypothetical protein
MCEFGVSFDGSCREGFSRVGEGQGVLVKQLRNTSLDEVGDFLSVKSMAITNSEKVAFGVIG